LVTRTKEDFFENFEIMEKFSLEKWLKNKSHKVVTKDGRPVRIVCWDRNTAYWKIVGLVTSSDYSTDEIACYYDVNGNELYSSLNGHKNDLFFADEEKKLTEFEKAMKEYYFPELDDFDLKRFAKGILDLARKELEKNYYTKVLDDRMVFKSELHSTDLQAAYDMGKQDALKSMPKWKKATEDKDFEINEACILNDDIYPIIATNVNIGEYYLELDELKNLPLEESI
jgi:hypothetical protein